MSERYYKISPLGRNGVSQRISCRPVLALSLFFVVCVLYGGIPCHAGDEPFANPTNWGGTGLMETPTARVMKEGRYRVGVSQIDPYRYYYGAVSPFEGLEINARVTQVLDVPALTASYGDYKDKAIDLKYQFIPEGKYLPAIAIGIMDPQGTRLYSSQYLVMSKQIYPFDFTLGFGNGRFGKKPLSSSQEGFKAEIFTDTSSWLSDSQFFGGIEFALSDQYAFMVEYNPIRYNEQTQDPAQQKYFTEAVPSKFNFGFRWRPFAWTDIDVSYQRGNQLGVNLSFAFDIGNPFIPIYDRPYRERPEQRSDPLTERIALALYRSGFMDIGIVMDGEDLWIKAENIKYYYQPRAIGVVLRAINEILPPSIRRVHLVLTNNGIPLVEFVTLRGDMALFYEEKLTLNEFFSLSEMNTEGSQAFPATIKHKKYFDYGIKPEFRTFLNDPSGYFKYRLGVSAWVAYRPWRGASLVAGPEYYFVNTISTSNAPLTNVVRSDIVSYQQEDVGLGMLLFEQIEKFNKEIYGRLAAGLLEIEYAGFDGEVAKPFFGGRLMVGVSGSLVKKREPGSPLQLKSDDLKDHYSTAFLNARLNIPEAEVSIDLKSGQFLAADRGARITISKFFNGVILSAWYGITDTSSFADPFNKGYDDKGIAITIPIRLFTGTDSRTAYKFSMSPWLRDVAQDIDHYNTLFDYMGRNVGAYLEKDKGRMR